LYVQITKYLSKKSRRNWRRNIEQIRWNRNGAHAIRRVKKITPESIPQIHVPHKTFKQNDCQQHIGRITSKLRQQWYVQRWRSGGHYGQTVQ